MRYKHEATTNTTKSLCQWLPPMAISRLDDMRAHLEQRGLSYPLARKNGWYPSEQAGDAHPRIVVPATSGNPNNRFWQARLMVSANAPRWQSPHAVRDDAITLVWPETRPAPSIITEGPMDALAAAMLGYCGLGLLGITPPDAALQLVATLASRPAYLILDLDALDESPRLVRRLIDVGVHTTALSTYPYKDLAEAVANGWEVPSRE